MFRDYSTGGVVLATKDGRIVLENTLDARLEVVFKQQLPEVGPLLRYDFQLFFCNSNQDQLTY